MLGETIDDPDHLESSLGSIPGLGLLPVRTVLQPVKTTEQRQFTFLDKSEICSGYEIHMGQTVVFGEPKPLTYLSTGEPDGYFLDSKCWGTYLHGILDNGIVIDELLAAYTSETIESTGDFRQFKEEQFDKLADVIRTHVDMEQIYASMQP